MNDINQFEGENIGGLIRVNFIPVKDVLSIDEPIDNRITEPLELKEDCRWFSFYGTLGTIGFNEDPEETPNGEIFNRKIVAICPQSNPNIDLVFNAMRNERFIVDIYDANGFRKLVGSLAEGLKFSAALNTKTSMEGRNEHAISFYGPGTHKAFFYDI